MSATLLYKQQGMGACGKISTSRVGVEGFPPISQRVLPARLRGYFGLDACMNQRLSPLSNFRFVCKRGVIFDGSTLELVLLSLLLAAPWIALTQRVLFRTL